MQQLITAVPALYLLRFGRICSLAAVTAYSLLAESGMMHVQLPASFYAYRKQQHRWTCGPVQLWRRAAVDIWASSLPLGAKLELILCYFGIRKFATHWVSLGFFCTLVPLSMFTPEVSLLRLADSSSYHRL